MSVPSQVFAPDATGRADDDPPSGRSRRLLAVGGLGYPVLTLVGFAAFPEPPGGDVSAAHDPAWLAGHTGAVIAQSYVRALGAVAFLLLVVALGRVIEHRSRSAARLAYLGGGGYALLMLASQATTFAAADASRSGVDGTAIRVLDGLQAGLLDLSSLPAVLVFVGAGAVLLRSPLLPHWFALGTAVGVPLALLDAASYDGGPLEAVGLLGLAYFLLWSIAAGVVLLRSSTVTR